MRETTVSVSVCPDDDDDVADYSPLVYFQSFSKKERSIRAVNIYSNITSYIKCITEVVLYTSWGKYIEKSNKDADLTNYN